ncbi:hypothetical protein J1N35_044923 [Gossypium stocksii]|uniref:Peptide N-acetyl-beta-D-glucosaminyl asparaginase amidase A N-terminal domain-containing protein n=1 Tax=Gossypium stocksii TaxID=47602 RepID=A0A9D3ZG34_9ROSI|nr:hypothetical protein J1N35_044923 [Gossypium stocksii]
MKPSHRLSFLKSPNPSISPLSSLVPSLFYNMTSASLMGNLLFWLIITSHLIAPSRNFPRLSWNGMLPVKADNLIESLGFGYLELNFSGAAQLNLDLMGFYGVSKRILPDVAGNGPFREVVVSLDGEVIGAVWPFTVVYTGGINPLLWRPISAIGSFDLPTYDIEITPFLGNLLNGKPHKLSFSVTNALNVWYIDANLHLWLDSKSAKTEGKLLQYDIVPLSVTSVLYFKGLNGTFVTNTTRFISSSGWVKSSYGIVTTKSIQDLSYSNSMVITGNLQIINQMIHFNDSVYVDIPAPTAVSKKSLKRFLFYLYSDDIDQGNRTTFSVSNVTLGFDEKKFNNADAGSSSSSLRNLQKGKGVMVVKDNLVVSGVASTQQSYNYEDGNFCYSRNISSSNYTILYDEVRNTCDKRAKSHFRYGLSRWWPFPARRAFLASHETGPNGNQ